MKVSLLRILAGVVCASVGSCTIQPQFDAGGASKKLELFMPEKTAIAAIGWEPSKVDIATCGTDTPKPFTCKILTFGNLLAPPFHILAVYLVLVNRGWFVDSWIVI